ncbi:hypothetical protein [Streptomyces sp. SID10815]|nr:hypothetical protein [Streptomyces sp. SID10815]NEA50472.1 hypothetical protein [Streptomyces sp. SID10815]
MISHEEAEEHRRLARELGDLLAEDAAPQGLADLGWDEETDSFKGRRVA